MKRVWAILEKKTEKASSGAYHVVSRGVFCVGGAPVERRGRRGLGSRGKRLSKEKGRGKSLEGLGNRRGNIVEGRYFPAGGEKKKPTGEEGRRNILGTKNNLRSLHQNQKLRKLERGGK